MGWYQFYEIKSRKSECFVNGVRQVSLATTESPDVQCFMWMNLDNKVVHIQFLFDENMIEWKIEQGLILGETNRKLYGDQGIGYVKGVRTIHASDDESILSEGQEILRNSDFPPNYQIIINQTICV